MNIYYITRDGTRCHVDPIIASNKKGLVYACGGLNKVLVYGLDPSDVDAYLSYYEVCSSRVPKAYPVYVGRDSLCLEMVEGPTAADLLLEALANKDVELALHLVRMIGRELRGFHEELEKCPRRINASPIHIIVRERCSLAGSLSGGGRGLAARACSFLGRRIHGREECTFIAGHGDLHLYQAVVGERRIYFLDPGREPDTRSNPCLEYDLASLIRSIEYAVDMVSAVLGPIEGLKEALAYETLSIYGLDRIDTGALTILYTARALYEYYYEVSRNTGLEWIPARALQALVIDGGTLVDRILGEDRG